MAKTAAKSFDEITARLDEIVATVRSKDTSLERSLDLFDEAIELGAQAVDMVDSFEFSEREAELLDAQAAGAPEAPAGESEGGAPTSPSDAAGA